MLELSNMKLSPRIQQAINLASRLHEGQVRKGDIHLPYISHPVSVAWILSNYTDDEDIIIAGLLHDVLEDVKNYYYGDLLKTFGERVAQIVKGVSEDKNPNEEIDEAATWLERKNKYLAALEDDSDEALMVCAADKIHNLQSMINAYQVKGEALWDHFNAPKEKKLWLYEEIAKLLKERLNSPIVAELESVYAQAEKILLKDK
ncbi:MAG: HD domain-containing protein [Patescibacteria group bacterium]